jgi:hypothetical protein
MDFNVDQLEAASHTRVTPARPRSSAFAGMAFTLAVFVSAALLFITEPMFGKMVLPLLGGSPAVWTTCMLFFQGALLLGYLYAHIGPRWLGLGRHTVLHIVLLALCLFVLPIGVAETAGAFRFEHPKLWLLWILTLSLGAPFVLLSSTGPLLQVWFSKTSHQQAENPYFLYAASNAGSLLGLLSYPFLLEPMIPLKGQARLWSFGYVLTVLLVALSASYLQTSSPQEANRSLSPDATSRIGARAALRWTMLAFVPSSFFLALTTHLTTDVASVPLLWVIPLVLYLLSFTMVFGRYTIAPHSVLMRWQPIGLIALAVIDFWGPSASSPWLLPLHLIVFFITALVCHGELAASRPPASRLTDFYLYVAAGGVLGGMFNALVAPALFHSVFEYPLTLLVACAVRPRLVDPTAPRRFVWDAALILSGCAMLVATREAIGDRPIISVVLVASALAAVVCLRMSRDPIRFTLAVGSVVVAGVFIRETQGGILLKERNFFGVREVREDTRHRIRVLMHGTTKHGAQSTDPARRREPTSYYDRQGPLGDFFSAMPSFPGRKAAVIGLGTGGLAAYAGTGEEWTFYEIDPDIVRLARDDRYFTYLQDTPAAVEVIVGDGRLAIAKAASHYYDLIVIDAFSSDAIPLHLLTLEALLVYRSKLSEHGVLLFHLSNRYLDLEPVLGRLIQSTGLSGLVRANTNLSRQEIESGSDQSIWAAVAGPGSSLGGLRENARWRPLRILQEVSLWTDDFSNIFKVFHLPQKKQARLAPSDPRQEAKTLPEEHRGGQ